MLICRSTPISSCINWFVNCRLLLSAFTVTLASLAQLVLLTPRKFISAFTILIFNTTTINTLQLTKAVKHGLENLISRHLNFTWHQESEKCGALLGSSVCPPLRQPFCLSFPILLFPPSHNGINWLTGLMKMIIWSHKILYLK